MENTSKYLKRTNDVFFYDISRSYNNNTPVKTESIYINKETRSSSKNNKKINIDKTQEKKKITDNNNNTLINNKETINREILTKNDADLDVIINKDRVRFIQWLTDDLITRYNNEIHKDEKNDHESKIISLGEEILDSELSKTNNIISNPKENKINESPKKRPSESSALTNKKLKIDPSNFFRNDGIKFHLILADPPWQYRRNVGKGMAESKYPTMKKEDIYNLPITQLPAKNCALLLWTTSPMLPEGIETVKYWGFNYKTILFTWVKTKKKGGPMDPILGMGHYTRSSVEHILLGVRGNIKQYREGKSTPQVIFAPRKGHSEKPMDLVCERLKELFGGYYDEFNKIELFARKHHEGWKVW